MYICRKVNAEQRRIIKTDDPSMPPDTGADVHHQTEAVTRETQKGRTPPEMEFPAHRTSSASRYGLPPFSFARYSYMVIF